MSELTDQGIAALKEGRRDEAYRLLMEAVLREPRDAVAWLWLADAAGEDEQRADCLRCVLDIQPDNMYARVGLEEIEVRQALAQHECPVCGRTGRVACGKCQGARTELCPACQGQTFRTCEACRGLGWVNAEALLVLSSSLPVEETWNECARCNATGFVDCGACRARGRDWCHTCEGSGQVMCSECAPARLGPWLGDELAEAVLCALRAEREGAQKRLAQLQASSLLADFLWRVGFADRPYHVARRLRTWVEAHPLDRAGRALAQFLPQLPDELLPLRDRPVQLIKKLPPTAAVLPSLAPTLVTPTRPANALNDAIMAARIGNRDQALLLLLQAAEQEPRNDQVWLWLARVMDTDAQRRECLRRALELNPANLAAQEELGRLAPTR
jgi:tetratricopeptide (TPR) repeat protein